MAGHKNYAFLTILDITQKNIGFKYKKVFLDILHIQVMSQFSPIRIQIAPGACVIEKIKSIDLS